MHKTTHPIATAARFTYLNSYAFLLLTIGVGATVVLVFFFRSIIISLPAALIAFFSLRGGLKILGAWTDKKRKYDVLIARNSERLRPETFKEFMQAPCGRLLSKVVLRDLNIPERYADLKVLRTPWHKRIRGACSPESRRTVVHSFKPDDLK